MDAFDKRLLVSVLHSNATCFSSMCQRGCLAFYFEPSLRPEFSILVRIQKCKFQSATTCKDVLPGLYLGANSKPLTRAPYFGANTMLSTLFHLPRKNTGGPFWCVYHVSAICCLDLKIGYLHKYFGIVEKIPFVISSAMLIENSHFK